MAAREQNEPRSRTLALDCPHTEALRRASLEKRLWDAADQFRANSGLKAQEYSGPILGLIFLRFAEVRVRVAVIEPAATRTLFETSSVGADRPQSVYDASRAKYLKAFGRAMDIADTPESVADTIVLAARAKTPQLRYPSGKAARQVALARRFLPRSVFDRILRSQFGLA